MVEIFLDSAMAEKEFDGVQVYSLPRRTHKFHSEYSKSVCPAHLTLSQLASNIILQGNSHGTLGLRCLLRKSCHMLACMIDLVNTNHSTLVSEA